MRHAWPPAAVGARVSGHFGHCAASAVSVLLDQSKHQFASPQSRAHARLEGDAAIEQLDEIEQFAGPSTSSSLAELSR